MYNKLFTKILDSSIWLAPDPHRLVWITLLAAMDEDGNVVFASAANVAARARVTLEAAREALAAFEAPDPDSGDPDNEGRRIERFPGGWHVLNAAKYRALVTKAIIREQTRQRVARFREKSGACNADVTHAKRTHNAPVTPSIALSEADKRKEGAADVNPSVIDSQRQSTTCAAKAAGAKAPSRRASAPDDVAPEVWADWLELRRVKRAPVTATVLKDARSEAAKAGMSLEAFLKEWCSRGSQGLRADWIKQASRKSAGDIFDGAI